ncbi:hypothetical protein K456DRAFT_398725 [Colletotrichum gloeosporioides 23]|nr:hypothetical protein K456DRAFT_398725 [Colletotrichum gloeosporioides 23]
MSSETNYRLPRSHNSPVANQAAHAATAAATVPSPTAGQAQDQALLAQSESRPGNNQSVNLPVSQITGEVGRKLKFGLGLIGSCFWEPRPYMILALKVGRCHVGFYGEMSPAGFTALSLVGVGWAVILKMNDLV